MWEVDSGSRQAADRDRDLVRHNILAVMYLDMRENEAGVISVAGSLIH